jgi:hypothetical protein
MTQQEWDEFMRRVERETEDLRRRFPGKVEKAEKRARSRQAREAKDPTSAVGRLARSNERLQRVEQRAAAGDEPEGERRD